MLDRPGKNALAKFGDLFTVFENNRVLTDQINTTDMAIEVNSYQRPIKMRRNLLDMSRLPCTVIALNHQFPAMGEGSQDRDSRIMIKAIRRIDLRHIFCAFFEGRHHHIGIKAKDILNRNLGIRQVHSNSVNYTVISQRCSPSV